MADVARKQLIINKMTLAEYNALAEKSPYEMYMITDAVTETTATVVPSSVSSTYAMVHPGGIVEMGGIIEIGTLGAGVAVGNTPVVFPITLAYANFVPTLTPITDGAFKQIGFDVANPSVTGMDICVRNIGDEQASDVKVAWKVVGVING